MKKNEYLAPETLVTKVNLEDLMVRPGSYVDSADSTTPNIDFEWGENDAEDAVLDAD